MGDVISDAHAMSAIAADLRKRLDVLSSGLALPTQISHVPGTGVIALVGEAGAGASPGRLVIRALLLLGESITSETLRAVPISMYDNTINSGDGVVEQLEDLPELSREGLSPEEFSQLVGRHYRAWAVKTFNPAAAMAEAYGVKLATMHSWIREARLRKYLPPARSRRSRNGE